MRIVNTQLYDVLGVAPTATAKQIRAAYGVRLAAAGTAQQRQAIHKAYAVLQTPKNDGSTTKRDKRNSKPKGRMATRCAGRRSDGT